MKDSAGEVFNYFKVAPNVSEIHQNEFVASELEPLSVLYSSKVGRVVLVQNKKSKMRYAFKYIYKWKLVKFSEDEKLLKVVYSLGRLVGYSHQKNRENLVKYYAVQECSTLVVVVMQFYTYGNLLYHMRKLKTLREITCKKLLSPIVAALDGLHADKKICLSR